jgi:hypothetical protein
VLGSKCSQVPKTIPSKRTIKNKCKKLVTFYLQMKKKNKINKLKYNKKKRGVRLEMTSNFCNKISIFIHQQLTPTSQLVPSVT